MSVSTHAGFNGPGASTRTISDSGRALRSSVACDALPLFQSRAVGVGLADASSFAAIASGIPAPLPLVPFAFSSSIRASHVSGLSLSLNWLAVGVGQREVVGASPIAAAPTCSSRFPRPRSYEQAGDLSIPARGVPHGDRGAVASPSPLVALAPLRLWFPQTVGVGHAEETLSEVRSANVGSA